MKIISVADDETNVMFGLLGIQGFEIKAQNPKEFQTQFDQILQDEDIGVILLNEKYLIQYQNYFRKIKIQKSPLIVEIPDMKASFKDNYFQNLIEKFIGLAV
jgi:vacuolar-type H+-ATPase subunit F/Vma7